MSFARTPAFIGLAGLGLWLLAAEPVQASQSSYLSETVAALTPTTMGTGNVDAACTYNGTLLAGKVKIVDSFPDIRVKAVARFPDLKVQKVTSFADDCGEWQIVDSFPDFKIQLVDSFPDIEVTWVDGFAGLP